MAKYRTSQISARFNSDIKKVWNVVTNNADYRWRSDIEKIEILDDERFIEYSNQGAVTEFLITSKEEYQFYAFEMKNRLFDGLWTGEFSVTENGGSSVVLTENITVKNMFVRWISYLFWNLHKIQQVYIDDLRKKLGE